MSARRTTFSIANAPPNTVAPPPTTNARRGREPASTAVVPDQTKPAKPLADPAENERVKVFVRVRPTNLAAHETPGALRIRPDGRALACIRDDRSVAEFTFDAVLGPESSQADVYAAVARPGVQDVLRGYNATILAYGQTGAGKTHTLGNARAGSIGIIPRAAAEIFSAVESDSNNRYDITLSYLQIYCEQIQDLLRPENGENLTVREDSGGGVHVPALTSVQVSSLQDCLKLQQLGERNRTVAFTQLNAHSSRSHAVLILTVVKRRADSSGQGNEDATDPQQATTTSHSSIISPKARRVQIGKLYLVDLAGSERLKKSGSTGIRASEAKHINLSLTTLGMCVNARATGNAAHVPFRDSKLTRLLQDSLGGNARTSLVVAVCDALQHAEESMQSLSFGTRAMRVATAAKINECVEYCSAAGGFTNANIGASKARDIRSMALEKSLLERESELQEVQAALKAEQMQKQRAAEALQREKEEAQARAEEIARRHQEEVQSQLTAREQLEERLAAAEEGERLAREELRKARYSSQEAAKRWDAERVQLAEEHRKELQAVEDHWTARFQDCNALSEAQHTRFKEELDDVRRQWVAEVTAVRAESAAQHALMESKAAEAIDTSRRETQRVQEKLFVAEEALQEALRDAARRIESVNREAAATVARSMNEATQRIDALQRALDEKMEEINALKVEQFQNTEALSAQSAINEGLQNTVMQHEGSLQRKESELQKLQSALQEQTRAVETEQRQTKALRTALGQQNAALDAAEQRESALLNLQRDLEERFEAMEARATLAENAAEASDAARLRLARHVLESKRPNRAAAVIQRAWRAHRLAILQKQRSEGDAALHEAQNVLGSLAAQHADLERRRRDNLAFTGQTLVAESLGVLQEAVEGLVGHFLLSSRDLKALQRYRRLAGGNKGGRSSRVIAGPLAAAAAPSGRGSVGYAKIGVPEGALWLPTTTSQCVDGGKKVNTGLIAVQEQERHAASGYQVGESELIQAYAAHGSAKAGSFGNRPP